MGFFDSVFSLLSSDVYADDNQAKDELQSGSGKAYGESHETPDHKEDASAQKSTEESSKDLKTTPKDTDESDHPDNKDGSGQTDEQAEASDDEEEAPEEEEEEEDEPVDPMPRLLEECEKTKECRHAKIEFDECTARVTAAADSEHKGPHEDCVEEFFHLTHCTMQCAAPKLFKLLA